MQNVDVVEYHNDSDVPLVLNILLNQKLFSALNDWINGSQNTASFQTDCQLTEAQEWIAVAEDSCETDSIFVIGRF